MLAKADGTALLLSEELSWGTWHSLGSSPPENDTALLVPSSVQPLGVTICSFLFDQKSRLLVSLFPK